MAIASVEPGRRTLTRQRVLEAAVELADRHGIEAVSMRRLALELSIEPMSLYTHVRSKDDLLDGMVEVAMSEVPERRRRGDWKAALRRTILDARDVLHRHPWASGVIETRAQPGPAILRQYDQVMGILRGGGFSIELTHHALHLLGSRLVGFTRELFDDSPDLPPDAARALADQLAPTHPHVAEMALAATHDGGLGGCDTDYEFEWSLGLILDGLDQMLLASGQSPQIEH